MNLETMLSERNQSQKTMIPCICNVKDRKIYTEAENLGLGKLGKNENY